MKRIYLSGAEKERKRKEKRIREEKGKRCLEDFGWFSSKKKELSSHQNEESEESDIDDPGVDQNVVTEKKSALLKEVNNYIIDKKIDIPEFTDNKLIVKTPEVTERKKNTNILEEELDKTSLNGIVDKKLCTEGITNIQLNNSLEIHNDPPTWRNLSSLDREYLTALGPPINPLKLPRDKFEGRNFPIAVFKKKLPNKEVVQRDWLVWSKSKEALFCFPCCLFLRTNESETSGFCKNGVKDNWRKLYKKVKAHESNSKHLNRYLLWKDLDQALNSQKGIDSQLQASINVEKEKMRNVLRILIDITMFLAENNLPFRGTHSTIEHDDCGLFLSTAKLVSRYNDTLQNHLDNIKKLHDDDKKMSAHYLSPRSQNEFLEICAKKVQEKIGEEIKHSVYYGIIVDGTPDVSHKEQLVFIIRYIYQKDGVWDVQERFLTMIDYEKKTGVNIAQKIEDTLLECGLDLKLCRGQGYDNAANMSGKYNGVKSKIQEKCPQALFSPCSAHSLNLCGVHSMETSPEVKTFFGNVQKLYTFFSCSPSRWKILQETAKLSLHSISTTRWSARIDAVRPLKKNYSGIFDALIRIKNEINLPADNHAELIGLIDWLQSFEFILLGTIWYKILQCIDDRSKILQSSKLCMDESLQHIYKLTEEIQFIKDSWSNLVLEAKSVASTLNITVEFKKTTRIRRKTHFHDDISNEQPFQDTENKFKVEVFITALDRLLSDLNSILTTMRKVSSIFSPIINPPNTQLNDEEIKTHSEVISNLYPNDICSKMLAEELRIFYKVFKESNIIPDDKIPTSISILNQIYKKGLQNILPQICICLRIFASIPTSVSTGERSFSKLKLVKNYLRSTTEQNRLNHLILLSIEHKLAKTLNYEDVIDRFAEKKARKKIF